MDFTKQVLQLNYAQLVMLLVKHVLVLQLLVQVVIPHFLELKLHTLALVLMDIFNHLKLVYVHYVIQVARLALTQHNV